MSHDFTVTAGILSIPPILSAPPIVFPTMMNIFRIQLEVGHLDQAVTFYGKLLGLEGRTAVPGLAYFDCGPVILGLREVTDGATPRANAQNVYLATRTIEEAHARATALGALSKAPVPGGPAAEIVKRPWGERSFFAVDPWGNLLCFVDDATTFSGSR